MAKSTQGTHFSEFILQILGGANAISDESCRHSSDCKNLQQEERLRS